MSKTQVYHEKEFNPVFTRNRVFPDDFLLVASVDTDDVDDAFHLTNHIDHSWWENPGVTCHVPQSRSTSTGDVVVNPDGNIFVCETMGWTNVGNIKDQPLTFKTGMGVFNEQ